MFCESSVSPHWDLIPTESQPLFLVMNDLSKINQILLWKTIFMRVLGVLVDFAPPVANLLRQLSNVFCPFKSTYLSRF